MYFDIESSTPIDEFALAKAINFVLARLTSVKVQPKIHKCTASDIQKYSFHYIIDIACTTELNHLLSIQMDQKYKLLTKSNNSVFDTGVYKKENQSLRLPFCIKIDKQQNIDKRPFIITSDSVFSDFIVSDHKNCSLIFEKIIHFDNKYPIDPAKKSEQIAGIELNTKSIVEIISKNTETSES